MLERRRSWPSSDPAIRHIDQMYALHLLAQHSIGHLDSGANSAGSHATSMDTGSQVQGQDLKARLPLGPPSRRSSLSTIVAMGLLSNLPRIQTSGLLVSLPLSPRLDLSSDSDAASSSGWLNRGFTETPPTSPDDACFVSSEHGFVRLPSQDAYADDTHIGTSTQSGSLCTPIEIATNAGLVLKPATPEQIYELIANEIAAGGDCAEDEYRDVQPIIPCVPHATRYATNLDGWKRVEHGQGYTYFIKADNLHVATASRMDDPTARRNIRIFIDLFLQRSGAPLPDNQELVLHMTDARECLYYICDHNAEKVGWAEPVSADDTYYMSFPKTVSATHLERHLVISYALHMQVFSHRDVSVYRVSAIAQKASYDLADDATNDSSTSAYPAEELEQLLRYIPDSKPGVERTEILMRYWQGFLSQAFHNRHYEAHPRLLRTQSLHNVPRESRTFWFRLIALLLLFNIPNDHLRNINEVWVDEVVYGKHFQNFVKGLTEDWKHHTFIATVLLTANIGFLAIPAVSDAPGTRGEVLHYLSNVSMVLSFASMFVGIIITQAHKLCLRDARNSIVGERYFQRHAQLGLPALAVAYSLPLVFLQWSACIFAGALGLFGFSLPSASTAGNVAFGFTAVLVSLAVLGAVAFFWLTADDAAQTPHGFATFWWDPHEFFSWTIAHTAVTRLCRLCRRRRRS